VRTARALAEQKTVSPPFFRSSFFLRRHAVLTPVFRTTGRGSRSSSTSVEMFERQHGVRTPRISLRQHRSPRNRSVSPRHAADVIQTRPSDARDERRDEQIQNDQHEQYPYLPKFMNKEKTVTTFFSRAVTCPFEATQAAHAQIFFNLTSCLTFYREPL